MDLMYGRIPSAVERDMPTGSLITHAPQGGIQRGFNPYEMNGGTILGIAGEDYVLLGTDTRLTAGFVIYSRQYEHVRRVSDRILVGSVGFEGDVATLSKMVDSRLMQYRHDHSSEMSVGALANMLSTTLYYRRFFPYYVYNLVAGLDEKGRGALFAYDPVGSYEREAFRAGGSSGGLLQSVLDALIAQRNRGDQRCPFLVDEKADQSKPPADMITGVPVVGALSKAEAVALARDAFVSAAERDIHCGDGCTLYVLTSSGELETHKFPLRKD